MYVIVRDTVCLLCLHRVGKLELKLSWGQVQFDRTIFEIVSSVDLGGTWWSHVALQDVLICDILQTLGCSDLLWRLLWCKHRRAEISSVYLFFFLVRSLYWLFLTSSVSSDSNHFGWVFKLFWWSFCDWQWCWFPDLEKIRRIKKFCFKVSSFGGVRNISPVLKWKNVVDGDSCHLVNNAETTNFSEEAELLKYMLSSAELHSHQQRNEISLGLFFFFKKHLIIAY